MKMKEERRNRHDGGFAMITIQQIELPAPGIEHLQTEALEEGFRHDVAR